MNGESQPRSISRALPVNRTVAEVLLLILLGAGAVILRARLRVPLQLPGHHGLEVMALLMIGRRVSSIPFATSISSATAALCTLIPVLGFNDPFLPLVFVLMGAATDLLYHFVGAFKTSHLLFVVLGGISYMIIPLSRILIHLTTGYPYNSLTRGGPLYPVATHFLFGAGGTLLAVALVLAIKRIRK